MTLRFRFSFFAVLTVMLLLCSARVTLLCVLASLLHECGHLLAMALVKCPPRCVTFGAGGIVIDRGDRFAGRGAECFFALGGIGMNLLLAAASFLRYRMTRAPWAMLFFWANMLPPCRCVAWMCGPRCAPGLVRGVGSMCCQTSRRRCCAPQRFCILSRYR